MENKDLIIITLVVLNIYLYHQQTQQKVLPVQPNNQELQELRHQVNHYQTLYQQRVEKDIGDEEKVKELTEQVRICEEIINRPQTNSETQTDLSAENIIN